MSRLAPAMPGAGAAVGTGAKEDESLLTVAEKGLKRVYDLLREQVGVCMCMDVNGTPGDWCLPCSAFRIESTGICIGRAPASDC